MTSEAPRPDLVRKPQVPGAIETAGRSDHQKTLAVGFAHFRDRRIQIAVRGDDQSQIKLIFQAISYDVDRHLYVGLLLFVAIPRRAARKASVATGGESAHMEGDARCGKGGGVLAVAGRRTG